MDSLIEAYKKRKGSISDVSPESPNVKSLVEAHKYRQTPEYKLGTGSFDERLARYGDMLNTTVDGYNQFASNKNKYYQSNSFINVQNNTNNLSKYASSYLKELESNAGNYDDSAYNSIKSYLNNASKISSDITGATKSMQNFYSQFADENAYGEFIKYQNVAKAQGFDNINDMASRIASLKEFIGSKVKEHGTPKIIGYKEDESGNTYPIFQGEDELAKAQAEHDKLLKSYNSVANPEQFIATPKGTEPIDKDEAMEEWAEYAKSQSPKAIEEDNLKKYKAAQAEKEAHSKAKISAAYDRVSANKELADVEAKIEAYEGQYRYGDTVYGDENENNRGYAPSDENKKEYSSLVDRASQLKYKIYESIVYGAYTAKQNSDYDVLSVSGRAKYDHVVHGKNKELYSNLSDDQKNTLGYLYAKEGEVSAEQYLRYAQEVKNYEEGQKIAAEKDTWWEKALYTVPAGLNQFGRGIEGAVRGVVDSAYDDTDMSATSPTLYASSEIRKNIDSKVGGTLYDLGTTTANMIPSIMAGVITSAATGIPFSGTAVTAATMGTSAAGNAYSQAIEEGYTKSQATAYGKLIGASEALLGSILGGFGSVSGYGVKAVVKTINSKLGQAALTSISNVMKKVGAQLLAQAGGEFTEEYLQEILEPVYRNICFNENNEFKPFTEEALYSGILGALSSFLMSGTEISINKAVNNPSAIVNNVKSTFEKAKNILPERKSIKFESILTTAITKNTISELNAKTILLDTKQSKLFTEATGIAINENTSTQDIVSAVSNLNTQPQQIDSDGKPSLINAFRKKKEAFANTTQPTPTTGVQAQANPTKHIAESNVAVQNVADVNNGITAKANDSGAAINVKGIEKVKGGNVFVKTNNGITAVKDMTFDDPNVQQLYTEAAHYTTRAAKTFVAAYDGSQSVDDYSVMFKNFHTLGKLGVDYDTARSANSVDYKIFGETAAHMAYFAGENSVKAEETRAKFGNKSASNIQKTSNAKGVYTDNTTKKAISELENKLYTAIAKKTGLDIESVDKIKGGANAAYAHRLAKIILSQDAASTPEAMIHELSEFWTAYDKEGFDKVKNTVLAWFASKNSKSLDTMVKAYQNEYKKVNKATTYRDASGEMVRDAFSAAFASEQGITDFMEWLFQDDIKTDIEKKSIVQSIKDFITSVINTIKEIFNESTLQNYPAKKLITANTEFLTNLRKDILDGWNNAIENYKAGQNAETEAVNYSKKLGGYFPKISVSTEDISIYKLGNLNNVAEVKEKVFSYLKDSYVSTQEISKPIINVDTGMKIEIWKGGINETFGNANAYKNLSYNMKKIKLATMTSLAKLIKYGEVRSSVASNYHNPNSTTKFYYLIAPISVDGNSYTVDMDIKSTQGGNRFYIHKIKIAEGPPKPSLSSIKLNVLSANTTLPQNNADVNNSIYKNNDIDSLKITNEEETDAQSRKIPKDTIPESEAPSVFELAKQSAQGVKAESVYDARRKINTFSLNNNAADVLSITQAELNVYLKNWQYYSEAESQQNTISGLKILQRNKSVIESQKHEAVVNRIKAEQKLRTENNRNTAEMRETRQKILKIAKEFSNKLLKETDTKHIPESLKLPIIQLLQNINYTTDRTTPDKGIGATFTKLQAKYGVLKDNSENFEGDSAFIYDGNIAEMLDSLADIATDKRLIDLSQAELNTMYTILKAFKKMVANTNKLFNENRKETVEQLGKAQIQEMAKMNSQYIGKLSRSSNPLVKFGVTLIKSDMMKPIYFHKQIAGTPLESLFNDIYDGENTYADYIQDAETFANNQMKKYGYRKWDLKKKATFTNSEGISIDMTAGEMMALYATYKREMTNKFTEHLSYGGFVLGSDDNFKSVLGEIKKEKKRRKGDTNVTSKVDALGTAKFKQEDYFKLKSMLTKEQMGFVDAMVNYSSSVASEWGNEVSMDMFDIRIFLEKYYFPFAVADQVLQSNPGEMHDIRIKNQSFTKRTAKKANAPLVIYDFMEIWSKHTEAMALYSAFTLPIEDYTRVFNYKIYNQPGNTVKASIDNVLGGGGTAYIIQMLKDINGGVVPPSGEGIPSLLARNMKKAAVMFSASVAVQQPASIFRANSIIESKYFLPHKLRQVNSFVEYTEAKKYAPVARIKEWGYFDTHMAQGLNTRLTTGGYKGVDKIKGFFKDKEYRTDVYSFAAQKADEMAWGTMWAASKNKIKAENPSLTVGSKEYWEKVSELFTHVIRETQVYDSTLSRSQGMRSQGGLAKMIFSFMGEPTVSYNMLGEAIRQMLAGNRKKGFNIVKSVTLSIIAAAAAKAFIKAALDDEDEGKDDEGNITGTRTYWDKYLDAFVDEIPDNFYGMLPVVRDAINIFKGYDPTNQSFSNIQQLYWAVNSLIDVFEKENSKKSFSEAATDVALAFGAICGSPIKNLKRDLKGFYQTIQDMLEKDTEKKGAAYDVSLPYESRFEAAKNNYDITKKDIDGSNNAAVSKVYYDLYFEAMQDGETDIAKEIKQYLLDNGREEASIKSTYNDRLQENSPYTTDTLIDYLEQGQNTTNLIKTLNNNGYSNNSIKLQLKDYYKPLYQELYLAKNSNEMYKIRIMLFNLKVGYKADTFVGWIQDLAKKR